MQAYTPLNPEKMDFGAGRQLREPVMKVEYIGDDRGGREGKRRESGIKKSVAGE